MRGGFGVTLAEIIFDEATRLTSDGGSDDELDHLYCCCDKDIAICGTDISDATDYDDEECPDELLCVVCVDLMDVACRFCGATRIGACACGRCNS